ncbi:hypothetical protein AAG906_010595 [Vitis piasezkii]
MGVMEEGAGGSKPSMTYVQADTSNFREVVQRLTGPSHTDNDQGGGAAAKGVVGVKRPAFKLHERRQYTRTKLEIVKPPSPDFHVDHHHQQQQQLNFSPYPSPSSHVVRSPLGTPSSIFSRLSIEEEEKAIRERRFYLHPSPRSKPGFTEPELLTLFPLTSPKTSDGS